MKTLPSNSFVHSWETGRTTKPIIVLIGGYAGTGKSTLAHKIAKKLEYAQVLPTGILRSIAQTQLTREQHPAMFYSTYDLHDLYGAGVREVGTAFREQCEPITSIVHSVIDFMTVEKQHLIIEGNHIVPWATYHSDQCEIIELYTYVDDAAQHKRMLGGPTHNRHLTLKQFKTARVIHDMLVDEALRNDKQQFGHTEHAEAEIFIENKIASLVQAMK